MLSSVIVVSLVRRCRLGSVFGGAARAWPRFLFSVPVELASLGAQEAQFFRIGAAATSGTFFEIGGVVASAISKPAGSPPCERGKNCGVPGLIAVALATQGSVENLRMIAADQIRIRDCPVRYRRMGLCRDRHLRRRRTDEGPSGDSQSLSGRRADRGSRRQPDPVSRRSQRQAYLAGSDGLGNPRRCARDPCCRGAERKGCRPPNTSVPVSPPRT